MKKNNTSVPHLFQGAKLSLLAFGFILFSVVFIYAAAPIYELPIRNIATATTVSISTSAFTRVVSSVQAGRIGVFVSNPDSNTATASCVFSKETSSPTEATTVRPLEIGVGEDKFYPIADNIFLYCISLHTSAESIHVQEVLQTRP